jgi:hypothetical protein
VITISLALTIDYFWNNWIVLHVGLILISAIILKLSLLLDPRKPLPDLFWNRYERKFCLLMHILEHIFVFLLLCLVKNDAKKEAYIKIIENSVVTLMILGRFICFIWFFFKELNDVCEKVMRYCLGIEGLLIVGKCILLLTASPKVEQGQIYKFLESFLIFSHPIYTVFILAIVSGIYRESVQQPDVTIQISVPSPVILADNRIIIYQNGNLERIPAPLDCEVV